jgi:hypothetical protein
MVGSVVLLRELASSTGMPLFGRTSLFLSAPAPWASDSRYWACVAWNRWGEAEGVVLDPLLARGGEKVNVVLGPIRTESAVELRLLSLLADARGF